MPKQATTQAGTKDVVIVPAGTPEQDALAASQKAEWDRQVAAVEAARAELGW
jgi:hypothetical protein